MSRIGIVIVGAGWAGQRHIQAIRELGEPFDVQGIIDSDTHFCTSVAAEFGVDSWGADFDRALNSTEVDAIAICTPHVLHREMAIAAARAGKHVLVEKPMALSSADGRDMVQAAESAGVSLVVAENQVYDDASTAMRSAFAMRHPVGDVAFGQVVAGYRAPNPSYAGRRAWLTQPDQGGTGTWWLQGVHTVARCRAIFGDIRAIHASEHRTPSFERDDLEGTMSCHLTTDGGTSVWLVQTPEVDLGAGLEIRAYGDLGRVELSSGEISLWNADRLLVRAPVAQQSLSSYALQYRAFANDIRGSDEAPTSGRRELNTLEAVEAALVSAKTGAAVTL